MQFIPKAHNCAKATDFKCEIDYAIWRKVHGKPSPWLLDSKFKEEGSFEDRFNSGDHQILLWELHDCARIGRFIPKWAADALYKILYQMAKGGLPSNSWNGAFGRPYADRKQPGGMRTRAQMFDAYREVVKLQAENKANKKKAKMSSRDIYAEAGKRLRPRQNADAVKKLYGDVNRAVKNGQWDSTISAKFS